MQLRQIEITMAQFHGESAVVEARVIYRRGIITVAEGPTSLAVERTVWNSWIELTEAKRPFCGCQGERTPTAVLG